MVLLSLFGNKAHNRSCLRKERNLKKEKKSVQADWYFTADTGTHASMIKGVERAKNMEPTITHAGRDH